MKLQFIRLNDFKKKNDLNGLSPEALASESLLKPVPKQLVKFLSFKGIKPKKEKMEGN